MVMVMDRWMIQTLKHKIATTTSAAAPTQTADWLMALARLYQDQGDVLSSPSHCGGGDDYGDNDDDGGGGDDDDAIL